MIAGYISFDVDYRLLPFDLSERLKDTIKGQTLIVGERFWRSHEFKHDGAVLISSRSSLNIWGLLQELRAQNADAIVIGGDRLLKLVYSVVDVLYVDLFNDRFPCLTPALYFDHRELDLDDVYVKPRWNHYTYSRRKCHASPRLPRSSTPVPLNSSARSLLSESALSDSTPPVTS
jgi:hypothetical protein